MAEKSFFKNILNVIVAASGKKSVKNLSAQQAISLQKNYIESLKTKKNDLCTPPYIEIAKQLTSDKSEVFRAAVWYLNEIANNESRYKVPIVSILRNYSEKSKRSKEDLDYLNSFLYLLEQEK